MKHKLTLDILPQPTLTTCGPTCLHAVYRYWEDPVSLGELIDDVPALEGGGTLAVELGRHALRRGYRAQLFTLNLQVFDPSWFGDEPVDLSARLVAQRAAKAHDPRLCAAIDAYLDYIERGGRIDMRAFTTGLVRRLLEHELPILAGLSATWLYQSKREHGPECEYDDIRGEPSGHFVVLAGYNPETKRVLVADPYLPNPLSGKLQYTVDIQRVISAIHLGILTYDANLLVISPPRHPSP